VSKNLRRVLTDFPKTIKIKNYDRTNEIMRYSIAVSNAMLSKQPAPLNWSRDHDVVWIRGCDDDAECTQDTWRQQVRPTHASPLHQCMIFTLHYPKNLKNARWISQLNWTGLIQFLWADYVLLGVGAPSTECRASSSKALPIAMRLLGRLLRVDLIKPVSNVRPSVRPSTKRFFDFNKIWYVGRGGRVMHHAWR